MKQIVIGFLASLAYVASSWANEQSVIGAINPSIPANCRQVSGSLLKKDHSMAFRRLLCESSQPSGSSHVFWLEQFTDSKRTTFKVIDKLVIPIEVGSPRLLDPTEDGCRSSKTVGPIIALAKWNESDRGKTISNIEQAWQLQITWNTENRFVPIPPSDVTCVPYVLQDR